jgi:hypothetical protein
VLVTAGRLHAPRAAVWLLSSRASLHDVWDPALCRRGRTLEHVGENFARDALRMQVGKATFKKGSIPRAVAMPSHSPHASIPSTFQAPGWGAPAMPSSRCWRSATSRRLPPFSHRSTSRIFIRQPGCIPSPMVTQDGDHQFDGGDKQAGLRPLPRPQLQGSSSSLLGRRARRAGACLRVGWRPASSSSIRGRKPSSSSVEDASSSHAGEGELLLPGQGAAFRPPSGRLWPAAPGGRATRRMPRVVLMCWDGPVLVLVSRTGVRTCRCALGRPPLADAVLVGRWPLSSVLWWWQPEKVSPPMTPSVPPVLRASGSLALMAGSRLPRGDANEGLPAVAFALGPSLLLSCRPRRRSLPRYWCSGRRRATRSLSSRGPSDVEVVHTRGSGTGVPFVMAP